MTEPTFTTEQLGTFMEEGIVRDAKTDRWYHVNDLAAFALSQVERAERAEAERDEARRELAEAEEAIRRADPLLTGLEWNYHPAVRRALGRKP